eukprot:jgi/Picsp_1/323/NSC_00322-R1_hypothetical protein CHLNCDRAFT_143093 [Chlorella variabilis]
MKIAQSMESDADRRQKWEENLTREARLAASSSRILSLPTKPWGFWNSERNCARYMTNADPAMSKMPGRSRPNILS